MSAASPCWCGPSASRSLNEPTASSTPVTVTSAIFLGEILRIEAQMDGGDTLLIRCTDTARRPLPDVGDRLHVSWGPEDCWVLT